jgi:O-acetyl-ADP-ribose deacetylase (regulator of RNase III)
MSEITKALRLAELIQSRYGNDINDEAATELRRLSTVNARLLEALNLANQFITNGIGFGFIRLPDETQDTAHKTQSIVRAAIELATQED